MLLFIFGICLRKHKKFNILQNYIRNNEVLYNITNYSKIYAKVINKISKSDFISSFFDVKIKDLKRIISKKFSKNIVETNLAEKV